MKYIALSQLALAMLAGSLVAEPASACTPGMPCGGGMAPVSVPRDVNIPRSPDIPRAQVTPGGGSRGGGKAVTGGGGRGGGGGKVLAHGSGNKNSGSGDLDPATLIALQMAINESHDENDPTAFFWAIIYFMYLAANK